MKTTLLASAMVCLIATQSQAITLLSSESFTNGDVTIGSRTITAADLNNFDANGVDKLVITIGGEGSGNAAADNTVTGVTYGGQPMLTAIADNSGNRRTSIWYLDNVTTTGDFVISFAEDQDGIGFGAYALDGTAPGFANTVSSGGATTFEIVTTTPDEFVVAALGRNNFDELLGPGTVADSETDPTTFGTQPPLTELFYANLGGSSAASAYATLATPDTYELAIYENNSSGRIVAAAFQAADMGPTDLLGDYNSDDVVSLSDYTIWRNNLGTSNVLPNDDIGGVIGEGQYNQWRSNFGATASLGGSATTVPEPTTVALASLALIGLVAKRRSRS